VPYSVSQVDDSPDGALVPEWSGGRLSRSNAGRRVTPRDFPHHTVADVDQAFRLAREVGQYAVFIYQQGELNSDVVKAMFVKANRTGPVLVLGLSPTTLDRRRKELDLPAPVRLQAGTNLSFSNRVIRAAYITAAGDLAQLKPPSLRLATEINLLAMQRLPELLHFVSLYKEAYQALKLISPKTKVFVTFQWEQECEFFLENEDFFL
jgi:hypothetical protein